jgi:hypothetical protein
MLHTMQGLLIKLTVKKIILVGNLKVVELIKKCSGCYWTQRFINVFTNSYLLALSWTTWLQPTPLFPLCFVNQFNITPDTWNGVLSVDVFSRALFFSIFPLFRILNLLEFIAVILLFCECTKCERPHDVIFFILLCFVFFNPDPIPSTLSSQNLIALYILPLGRKAKSLSKRKVISRVVAPTFLLQAVCA